MEGGIELSLMREFSLILISYTDVSCASDKTGVLEDDESTSEAPLLSRVRPSCQLRLCGEYGGVLLFDGGPELVLSLLERQPRFISSSPCRYWQISSGSRCSSASISLSSRACC